jgi:nucleoside-diphosphate-sugar epimerase
MKEELQNNNGSKVIFITGATGLTGSHLLKALSSREQIIKALYRTEIPASYPNVEWIKGDIFDAVLLDEMLQGVDEVYHCAAKISYNPKDKNLLFKTNVEGTANIVNACLNNHVKKLLHISSIAALDIRKDGGLTTEAMQWNEETTGSAYGKSKYLGEMEVWRGIAEGLRAVIINPSVILGAGDWNKGSSEMFKTVYNEFLYYSTGVNGFVDVKDVVAAMIALMQSDIVAERFIVSAANISYEELFTMIATAFQKKPPSKKVTPWMAAAIWRIEKIKTLFTGKAPFITKETAGTALAKAYFDNARLLKALPGFQYTPIQKTIESICHELLQMQQAQ